ncbi:MAG: hypothetical protein AB1631_09985 [Acidobacteriota bacterium]
MKLRFAASALLLALLVSLWPVSAQDKVTVTSEADEGLDLIAVGQLFKESENLEAFEKALNDSDVGVNNLDLDDDGQVDFIRVVEDVAEGTHLIILQASLGENEFQDVATIEIEKESDERYNFQLHGNEEIYGVNYYVASPDIYVYRWPIITFIYRPAYRPYRSVYRFGFYPRWYRPFRPVTIGVYRTRTVRYKSRTTFTVTRTTRVRSVSKVHYTARTSTRVKKKTTVTRTTTVKRGGGKTTKTKVKRKP